jgi:3-oxoacyl-[acyl-carrier protein] reductase
VTAVVTGASRGIGRAAALALAEKGVSLALLGRPSAALDQTLAEVRKRNVHAEAFACDLARAEEIRRAAEGVIAAFGAPSVLVNNAGVIRRASVERMSLEEWTEQIDVNLRAPFLLCQALLPAMRRANTGRIIHIGSISSTLGSPLASAYCASKWALVGFMKSLAEELSGTGLMTVALLPGSVDTEMLAGSGYAPKMTADEVAKAIAYFALEAPLAHNGGVVEMFGA